MLIVDILEAQMLLPKLVERAAQGEDIIFAKAGRPVARLVPAVTAKIVREPGSLKGRIRISGDFDAPLCDAIQATFEAR